MLNVKAPGIQEPLIASDLEIEKGSNGSVFQISFNAYKFEGNVGFDLLNPNVVIEDESGHEYVVRQLRETNNTKSVVANHVFYELVAFRRDFVFRNVSTLNEYLNLLLQNTGWTFVNDNVVSIYQSNNFGNDNIIVLINRLIEAFNCEFEILPGRVLRFASIIGNRNQKQYRLGSNIRELSRVTDTSNVRTRITVYGANGLTYTYTSPLAENPNFGIIVADPITDQQIDNLQDLQLLARTSLNDVVGMNIEVSVSELDGEVGDYVYLIHDGLGIDIETRIISKKMRPDENDGSVELGNIPRRSIEDIILDQRIQLKKELQNIQATQSNTQNDIQYLQGENYVMMSNFSANDASVDNAYISGGNIVGATNIQVQTNVAVGEYLYFGGYIGSSNFIECNENMSFNSSNNFNFYGNDMYLNGKRILTTDDL